MLMIIVPLTVLAATEGHEPVGRMTTSAAGLSLQIGSENESVSLTISGPNNFQYSHQFASARSISLRLRDIGASLPDGSYTYEVRLAPRVSDGVRAQMAAAREAADDAALDRIRDSAGLKEVPSQSGSFSILNGSLVSSETTEPTAPVAPITKSALSNSGSGSASTQSLHNAPVRALDVVTADDAIIQGSACIGLDCVNNESFGFDTIRLKENNTRIKFDDTSSSTGFANHDWQLTANDSASGGANKFSIEDITAATVPVTITGSAPTNSIFVDSTGRLGLRTATPVLDIHVATSNTPAMRLEQNSSGGFTAQTWDVGGNEANFFVRDVTGGSRLPFRIRPGAPTSSIDISASGSVGINNASPNTNAKLDINGAIRLPGIVYPTTDNAAWIVNESGAGLAVQSAGTLRLKTGGTTDRVTIDASGNIGIGVSAPTSPIQHSNGATLSVGGVWTNASSRELKQDICDLNTADALGVLKEMNPVTYSYKIDPTEHHVGFIAEDVPDLVATKDRKGLSAMDVVAVLTSVVKEQQKNIDDLKVRLEHIEKKQ
jgi:hypothetical protein